MEPTGMPPTETTQPQAGESLVQCEVTGKWVAPDEIVEINGMRVCAEGKQVLLQRLKTGEAIPGQLERPTVLRRFACILVDVLILVIPAGILSGVIGFILGARGMGGTEAFVRINAAASLVAGLAGLLYFALMHGYKGQTLGKMAGRIKVVNLDGSPITMNTAFLRALYSNGVGLLGAIFTVLLGGTMSPWIQLPLYSLPTIWGITSTILALVDTHMQRALHDRLAGTRVVQVQ